MLFVVSSPKIKIANASLGTYPTSWSMGVEACTSHQPEGLGTQKEGEGGIGEGRLQVPPLA
jgi:hypothetical protein